MAKNKIREKYPEIPQQEFFTIGEASRLCLQRPHTLRYWEREFPQLQKVARRNNRRYYTRNDILLMRVICDLLYNNGYTIAGAKVALSQQGQKAAVQSQVDVSMLRQRLSAAIKLL